MDPWIYHSVGGLRPPTAAEAPRLTLGVECEVMQRVKGAAAETMIHGQKARSAWSWDGRTFIYNATVPVGFRALLVLPGYCNSGVLSTVAEGEGILWSADQVEAVAGVESVQRNKAGDIEVEIVSGVFSFHIRFEGTMLKQDGPTDDARVMALRASGEAGEVKLKSDDMTDDEPLITPRSSLRWLSMYTSAYHCQWGCRNTTAPTKNYNGCQPVADKDATVSSNDGWTNLPTIQGDCLKDGVEWPRSSGVTPNGCWLDQLATSERYNSSTMLMLQTSDYPGPLFCGHSTRTGDPTRLCPDDCDDPALSPALRAGFLSGLRSPGVGSCGLAWLRKTMAFVRPLVAAGAIGGFMLGDELMDAMNSSNISAVGDAIHQQLDPLEHFVYTNEGTHVFSDTGWGPNNRVPAGIDILSIDGYEYGANESLWHQQFYEAKVFPALRPHQRVAVVPVSCI